MSSQETVVGDWRYSSHDLDTDENTFPHHSSIFGLWSAKRTVDRLPDWADFDLGELQPWWGWLTVLDVVSADPMDGIYRLWGTNVVRVTGLEMTGKRMSDHLGSMPDATSYIEQDLGLFADVAVRRRIGYQYGPVWKELIDYTWLYILRMPLAGNGVDVDKILSAVFAIKEDASST